MFAPGCHFCFLSHVQSNPLLAPRALVLGRVLGLCFFCPCYFMYPYFHKHLSHCSTCASLLLSSLILALQWLFPY